MSSGVINEQIGELIDHLHQQQDNEDERMKDYKFGRFVQYDQKKGYNKQIKDYIYFLLYHPVHIEEKFCWGRFSTVWLANDFKYDTYVAFKIQKSESHYLEEAYDEVECIKSCKIVIDQLNYFKKGRTQSFQQRRYLHSKIIEFFSMQRTLLISFCYSA